MTKSIQKKVEGYILNLRNTLLSTLEIVDLTYAIQYYTIFQQYNVYLCMDILKELVESGYDFNKFRMHIDEIKIFMIYEPESQYRTIDFQLIGSKHLKLQKEIIYEYLKEILRLSIIMVSPLPTKTINWRTSEILPEDMPYF